MVRKINLERKHFNVVRCLGWYANTNYCGLVIAKNILLDKIVYAEYGEERTSQYLGKTVKFVYFRNFKNYEE